MPPDPHRWTPPAGAPSLDAGSRAALRRWRRPSSGREPGTRHLAAALVLVLHGLFAAALWQLARPVPRAAVASADEARAGQALQVRFIPRAPATAPRADREVPPVSTPAPPRRVREAPRPDAMQVAAPAPSPALSAAPPAVAVQLFDADGMARLPAAPATAAPAPAPGYVQRRPDGDMQVMSHATPIPPRTTRFEAYFPPPGENAAQAGLRKAVQALQGKGPAEKTVNLPRGIHLRCKTLLGVPTPFCGLPPAPPPPNDGDARLNLPSAPLAKDPHPPAPPSLATCIAAWRSEGPLPYGCPVDTPARAVDAEIAECVALYRAGKRLKTWCPADTAGRAARSDASP